MGNYCRRFIAPTFNVAALKLIIESMRVILPMYREGVYIEFKTPLFIYGRVHTLVMKTNGRSTREHAEALVDQWDRQLKNMANLDKCREVEDELSSVINWYIV